MLEINGPTNDLIGTSLYVPYVEFFKWSCDQQGVKYKVYAKTAT